MYLNTEMATTDNSATMAEYVFGNYCQKCGWAADEHDLSQAELSAAAIEHLLTTGHDIDSEWSGCSSKPVNRITPSG